MNLKKLPQRMCVGCNSKKNKNELIRIVKNEEGKLVIDSSYKMSGRGIYICKSDECLNKVVKNKRISKIFEMNDLTDMYEILRKYINGGEFIG